MSKIFSGVPIDTKLNISICELAKTIDSLFKIKGAKKIVPLEAYTDSLRSELPKGISENSSFEYVTLEEAVADNKLNIKCLLREALTGKCLLYHHQGGWWPVPVSAINELYNGNNKTTSKIWSISNGNWLPIQIQYVEPIDEKWGKEHEPVQLVSLTIASLHIRKDDLEKILNKEIDSVLPQPDIPLSRKKESNLLKVIGGLIRTNYLQKDSGKFWNGKKPNISAIAEAFQGELRKAGYSDEGFQDSSLRKTISDALARIEENKNP
jgi:hypothetical protein